MKTIIHIKVFTLLILVTTFGCNDQQNGMSQSTPKYYPTAKEAIQQAKSDLLAVLKLNKDLAIGVDEKTLQSAEAGDAVRQINLDFNKLINADSTGDFEKMAAGEMSTVYPMVAGNRVITIVEIGKNEKGWSVTGLGGKSTAQDLDIVRTAVGSGAVISIYDVPNLQTKVYGVKKDGVELFYTNYGDRFSLQQGVTAAQLIPVLKAAALEFNRRYGDELKKQKLVK